MISFRELSALSATIAKCSNEQFAQVVWPEVTRRSINRDDILTRQGLYTAVLNGLAALLNLPPSDDPRRAKREAVMVDRIDAVGWGAPVHETGSYARVRAIEDFVDAFSQAKPSEEDAEMLAKTIEKKWPDLVPVDRGALHLALQRKGDGALTAVCVAAGIITADVNDPEDFVKKRNRKPKKAAKHRSR
jgi:hypothetical protein